MVSESNYAAVIDDFEKTPLIPYGMYEKEQKRKFKNDPTIGNTIVQTITTQII